jgi:hypothetical protein
MPKHIEIYYDTKDKNNEGWAYRVKNGGSGAIDSQASDAITRIIDAEESLDGDARSIRDAVEYNDGDIVSICPSYSGSAINLGDLLDR